MNYSNVKMWLIQYEDEEDNEVIKHAFCSDEQAKQILEESIKAGFKNMTLRDISSLGV